MTLARTMKMRTCLAATLMCAATFCGAHAEMTEITIAEQPSLGHVPLLVMQEQKLFEKKAEQLGIKNLTVKYVTFTGGAIMNDGLLSGSIQFAAGGVPPLLFLWSKTAGTPLEARAVAAMSAMPIFLNTNNPMVHSIKDFSDSDKIALPAVKVSVQAIFLQMAAEKAFGVGNHAQLDRLTVSMSHPGGLSALLSNQVTAHMGASPVQEMELNSPGIRTILNSNDVMGGPTTYTAIWTTQKFKKDNPIVYRAFVEALRDAMKLIKSDPQGAVDTYMKLVKGPGDRALIDKLINGSSIYYGTEPRNIEKFVDFMVRVGTLKKAPASWKDIFFDSAFKPDGK